MGKHQIEFLAHERKIDFRDFEEAFQLRKDRPAVWLQRACFYALRKLRAFYVEQMVSIERHTIDADTFMERLFKQGDSISDFFGMHPEVLLIGSEDYSDLMMEPGSRYAFSFDAKYGRHGVIYGLRVKVIPWMRGVLVMPNEAEY
jgi:hypothetical protein